MKQTGRLASGKVVRRTTGKAAGVTSRASARRSIEKSEELVPKRIVEVARRVFDQHGFVRVTMEEIALELRISKKTLYKYFPNKEALVRGVAHALMEEAAERFEPLIRQKGTHFLERLQLLMHTMSVQSASISPQFIQDLGQLTPEIWQEVEEFRRERLGHIEGLIRQGVKEGYIRSDVDVDLVVLIFVTVIQSLLRPQVLRTSKHSFPEILDGLMSLLFEGMLTNDGRKRIQIAGSVRRSRKLQLDQTAITLMLSPSLQAVLSRSHRGSANGGVQKGVAHQTSGTATRAKKRFQ